MNISSSPFHQAGNKADVLNKMHKSCMNHSAVRMFMLVCSVAIFGLGYTSNLRAADSPNASAVPLTPIFSVAPSDQEIMHARVFENPLVPVGRTTTDENRALAQALTAFLKRTDSEDVSTLTQFLDKYPTSAWVASLQLNLGLQYYHTARYSKCLSAWEEAWNFSKDAQEPKAHMMADMALGELLEMYARLGRMDTMEQLLNETKGRHIRGSATELIAGAREGLSSMQHHPEVSFRCGPLALSRIRAAQGIHDSDDALIPDSKSTTNGISLDQVCDLSKKLKMNYQMAFRSSGAEVILPAVIHWKLGHYAALIKENNGRYLAEDPTFVNSAWFTQKTLEEEGDGYFLVPLGKLPVGWRTVDQAEGETVWGKGTPYGHDPNYVTPNDNKAHCPTDPPGMAHYNIHLFEVSLNIEDTPLRYPTSFGPPVQLTVTYNQRESAQPTDPIPYSNLGQKWTFNWLAYIKDTPGNLSADVQYYVDGGGQENYTGFNTTDQTFAVQQRDQTTLIRTSSNSYELDFPDGSKKIFSQPDGSNPSARKVFLTQVIDPYGNTVSLAYNANLCLTNITDAAGLQTRLYYTSTNDICKITQVTDPFGRSASFQYNSDGQLTNITDMIGIHSSFAYGDGDFIDSMTTPYGTTTFVSTDVGTDDNEVRSLEATDPLGQKERVEYNQQSSISGISYSVSDQPANIQTWNNYMYGRNTFYWDKKAMAEAAGDYSKAKITHWFHSSDWNSAIGVVESEKSPLESRVWYEYPDESYPSFSIAVPYKIARVMDDSSTQLFQFGRNALGKATNSIDPLGRTTFDDYSTNLVDLLGIRQMVGTNTELLGAFTYSTNHLLLASVDAAGQTNYFGYNTHGQLAAVTNARNETVTLSYNTSGLLTNIVGALSGATASFTYDATNRLRTVTDSQGYTVTYAYDGLDRVTNVTYPDGSFNETVYQFLDPILAKDRQGHWAAMNYDPLRHLTDVYDSLGRHTHLEWCGCGSLESITDPMGNTTSWLRDIEGRVTTKIYPDQSQTACTYENTTSRLKTVTDAQNQSTTYDYFLDNDLAQVTYNNAVIATPSVSFAYDTNYNRMTTMTDGTGVTTYNYYAVTNGQLGAGRLLSVSNSFYGGNGVITYAYDELGRVSSRAIDGVAQAVTYDALGRVTVVTNALGSFTNVYVGATGMIATNFYPNGQKAVFSYFGTNNDERLQEILNQNNDGSTLSKFDYAYDAEGQITNWTQQADANTPTVQVEQYDPVNQLLSSTVRSNTVAGAILKQFLYNYDQSGNRTSETIGANGAVAVSSAGYNNVNQLTNITSGSEPMRFKGHLSEQAVVSVNGGAADVNHLTTNFTGYASVNLGTNIISIIATDYSTNSATNRYQVVVTNAAGTATLSYDTDGNMTNDGAGITYEYDAANRTAAINRGTTNRTEFTYDGIGRRVQIIEKTNGVAYVTNKYVWCGLELCEQRDLTGGTVTKRFFGEGEQISGTNYFFTFDHLGSIREVVNSSGTIQTRYDYNPYGNRKKISGTMDADFGFTGHFMIASQPETTLTLFRLYRTDLGRWNSRDPLQEFAGLNLYDYVANDPINLYDPNGDLDAVGAHDFYNQASANGLNEGGFWGYTKFIGAQLTEDFVDLTGVTSVQESWETVGYKSGDPCNPQELWKDVLVASTTTILTAVPGEGETTSVVDREMQALIDMAAQDSKRINRGLGPVSAADADAYIELANESGADVRASANDLSGAHGYGGIPPGPDASHIHIGGEHVPVPQGYQP